MISSNFDTSVNYIQIYYKFMLFQSVSSVGIFYHIQRASHPLASSLDKQVSQSVIMLMMKKKGGGGINLPSILSVSSDSLKSSLGLLEFFSLDHHSSSFLSHGHGSLC